MHVADWESFPEQSFHRSRAYFLITLSGLKPRNPCTKVLTQGRKLAEIGCHSI